MESTRITIQISPELAAEFSAAAARLGLRRDAYLNSILPVEVALLQDLPANSELAESHVRDQRSGHRQKLPIRLDRTVVARLNKACDAKRIPRDAFFESCLRHVVRNLHFAADVLENPRSYWTGEGQPYRELVWTDDEVIRWSANVEAVAQLKGITFGAAQSALLKLEKTERDRILTSKAVTARSTRIAKQAKSGKQIDLSEFL